MERLSGQCFAINGGTRFFGAFALSLSPGNEWIELAGVCIRLDSCTAEQVRTRVSAPTPEEPTGQSALTLRPTLSDS